MKLEDCIEEICTDSRLPPETYLALRAELEGLRMDAARYHKLRDPARYVKCLLLPVMALSDKPAHVHSYVGYEVDELLDSLN